MAENFPSFKLICKSFQIGPQQIYGLEAAGTIQNYPHDSPAFIRELATWHKVKRGPLPAEAEALLLDLDRGRS